MTISLREGDFFYKFPHVRIVQVAPIHQSYVYGWIKISRTIFEKGHQRKIPVKLFQNLTSGFREEFLKMSYGLYSARSPHSPEPCLGTDQNFAKGHPRKIPVKLFQNLTCGFREEFLKMSSNLYTARSHHSPEPYL